MPKIDLDALKVKIEFDNRQNVIRGAENMQFDCSPRISQQYFNMEFYCKCRKKEDHHKQRSNDPFQITNIVKLDGSKR